MDKVKEAAAKASEVVDSGLGVASEVTRSTIAAATSSAQDVYSQTQAAWDQAKDLTSEYVETFRGVEDGFFDTVKDGVEYCIAHPYVGYSILGTTAVLSVPPVRRLLFRYTFGRFQSEEGLLKSAEMRVGTLRTRVEEFTMEAEKLESRMLMAEEEMIRGRSKLKAARAELQRLGTVVAKNERMAQSVLQDLRQLKDTNQMRADTAQDLHQLKSTRLRISKNIARIIKQDI